MTDKDARLKDTVDRGLTAFWEIVAAQYPEIKSGDMDPGVQANLEEVAEGAVRFWLFVNSPVENDFLGEE